MGRPFRLSAATFSLLFLRSRCGPSFATRQSGPSTRPTTATTSRRINLPDAHLDDQEIPLLKMNPFAGRADAVLLHPDKVEARLIHRSRVRGADGKLYVHQELGPVVAMDSKVAGRLSDALRDPHSYVGAPIFCFDPGVQFDFYKRATRISIRVCFHCQNLVATSFDASEIRHLGEYTFSPGYTRFVQIAKQVFPDEKGIGALDEHHGFNPSGEGIKEKKQADVPARPWR